MNKSHLLIILFLLALSSQHKSVAQTDFELKPSQSMLMTGKGPGQDATINPYTGQICYAIIDNIGKQEFSIRIQKKGEIIETISITKGESKKVKLLIGYELYLDATSVGKVKARVNYEKISE